MRILFPLRIPLLLLLACLCSICLTQEIVIDRLNNLESADDGKIKKIPIPKNLTPLRAISVFGWIKIISSDTSGDILYFNPQPDSADKDYSFYNSLFCLYFVSWEKKTLVFSMVEDGNETEITKFKIPETELNSWIFVYLGHSFTQSKKTFYKFSSDSTTNVVFTKEVNLKNRHHSFSYHLIAGIGRFLEKTFFVGNIERLTVFFGDEAYKEENFESLHVWHPDRILNCSFSFTDCAYTGKAFDLCGKIPKEPISSILLNGNQTIQICLGQIQIKINKNIPCITDDNWMDLEQNKDITVESYYDNLCSNK